MTAWAHVHSSWILITLLPASQHRCACLPCSCWPITNAIFLFLPWSFFRYEQHVQSVIIYHNVHFPFAYKFCYYLTILHIKCPHILGVIHICQHLTKCTKYTHLGGGAQWKNKLILYIFTHFCRFHDKLSIWKMLMYFAGWRMVWKRYVLYSQLNVDNYGQPLNKLVIFVI